ncbi:MAG: class I tRNA ligase family protein, partial [Flavobacteriales bacterium]
MTKALLHENKIPWKDIVISGFATIEGKKMGRSKGIGINPQKAMDEFGSDALRYWAASSKLGEDMNYYEKDLIAGKKFVTKILNAANFVFMNLKYQKKAPKLIETDRLFLTQLNKLINSTIKALDGYN